MAAEGTLLLRILALGLSFMGLCMASRRLLKLNRFIAPGFAAASIIALITLAGMAGALRPALILIYSGGLAGLIGCALVKRERPDWILAGALAVLVGLLCWRFYGCHLYVWDDFSHWAVAARYPLDNDALPSGRSSLISFQSYPPGAAAFIYYFCRTLAVREDLFLVAENTLMILTALPLLAHMDLKKHRAMLLPVGACMAVLFKFNRPMCTLMVDWLLCFVGFGGILSVLYYRDDLPRAMLVGVPYMIASVYLKSSGAFFAVWTAVALAAVARKSRSRKSALRTLLACAAVIAGVFALWILYVKVSYPAALDTPHAVSAEAYVSEARQKGLRASLAIGLNMIRAWLHPDTTQIFTLIFYLASLAAILLTRRASPDRGKAALRRMALSAGVYASWFVMMYAMYVFSMPASTAKRLAAFSRYNSTGMLFAMLLLLAALVRHFQSLSPLPARRTAPLCAGLAALCLAAAPLLNFHLEEIRVQGFYADLFARDTEIPPMRLAAAKLKRGCDLPDEGRYLLYSGMSADYGWDFYFARYELVSGNLRVLARTDDGYLCGGSDAMASIQDPMDFIVRDGPWDAILVLRRDPEFESLLNSFLQTLEDAPPVYRAY